MSTAVALKVLLSPALIGAASWIAGRWGPSVGGWLVALPLTSGPVLLLIALDRGPAFARGSCIGALLAIVSLSAFALAYCRAALRFGWLSSVIFSSAAFVACTAILTVLTTSLGEAFLIVCAVLTIAIGVMPSDATVRRVREVPLWDIPVRMILAAISVCALTAAAATLGPQLSGLLTPFPIAATILAAFTHRLEGGAAATQLLRGLLIGLFSFAVFLIVIGATLEHWTIGAAFVAGTVVMLIVHMAIWKWLLGTRQTPLLTTANE